MQKGDILRITKWRGEKCEQPVWAKVTDILSRFGKSGYVTIIACPGNAALASYVAKLNPYEWGVDSIGESWRTYTETTVPNAYWAARAAYRLLA